MIRRRTFVTAKARPVAGLRVCTNSRSGSCRTNVDIIVSGATMVALEAQRAAATIPGVMAVRIDPVSGV
jgi:hypothetical protein